MRIHWAVFGEVKKGHDLMATSGDAVFAGKLTQYTDRPGDPPHGHNWGPVLGGFQLADRYVFLRTQPDPKAGRAGMVRSHAAFVPLADLARLNNIEVLFASLSLLSPDATLEPLDIPDSELARVPAADSQSGLVSLAFHLGWADAQFPLVWAAVEPYLPAVAALWGRLPATLRPLFGFAFQFAPELRLPTPPTLIVTEPALVSRWPAAQILRLPPPPSLKLDTAQAWLAGLPEGSAFSAVIEAFDIEFTQFSKLGLLATFADLITRLPTLSFAEAKRAVNIVAQNGRATATAATARATLFARMEALIAAASAEDLLGLRNLNAHALPELVRLLEKAMSEWIAALPPEDPWSPSQLVLLEAAVAGSTNWWSRPFLDWLTTLAKKPSARDSSRLLGLFLSAPLSEFLGKTLPMTNRVETLLVDALPERLAVEHADNLIGLAEERRWMKLHARALLHSRPGPEAIILHAQVARDVETGLVELRAALGIGPVMHAACETGEPNIIRFAGRMLAASDSDVAAIPLPSCSHLLPLLREALTAAEARLPNALRDLVLEVLADPIRDARELAELCLACAEHHPALLLEMPDPTPLFQRLPPAELMGTRTALNRFVRQEVLAGRSFRVASEAATALLDTAAVIRALAEVPAHDGARLGANAFRCLPLMTDDHCCRWLVDLFTRTQYRPLTARDVADIASLLIDRPYPGAARVVLQTAENFGRRDVSPLHERIRYTYQMARAYERLPTASSAAAHLPKVIIATALPLEREAVMQYLSAASYDARLFADVAPWPADNPRFEVYVIMTGAGNLSAQGAVLRTSGHGIAPAIAFFVGVCGAIKDIPIGDVVYSTKVYHYEGGKEEDGSLRARPAAEQTAEGLVQLAHRVASKAWRPEPRATDRIPGASPAVIASGEVVLASTEDTAMNLQLIKTAYNDSQVVEMEGYGFMRAMREENVRLAMVIRGVSDRIAGKHDSDSKGMQLVAMRNAAAFLFALLRECDSLTTRQNKKKRGWFSS